MPHKCSQYSGSLASTTGKADNHLVQILTGEGKSVTLAITAAIVALLGLKCDCVCYSEFLSRRDQAAFAGLFHAFGVTGSIEYGDFKSTCERLIKEQGDLRRWWSASC